MSLTVTFTDQSTPGPSGPITAWAWDFGDGGTSTSENPTHTYASSGTYTVQLTVTGSGSDGSLSKSHSVTVSSTVLTARFGMSSASGAAPLTVVFTDQSIAGPSGPITGWAWDFGDGGTSTSQNPSHTYTTPGSYTISLTVTGTSPDGTSNVTHGITVSSTPAPPPVPAGVTKGTGMLQFNHWSSVSTGHRDSYVDCLGSAWAGQDITAMGACAGRGLAYFNFSVVQPTYSTGVPYSQASANNWLLKDSSGNLIQNSFGGYVADVGLAAYQNAWVTNVLSYLSSHSGIDGIFIDAVCSDAKSVASPGGQPAKYPDTASWSNATISCLTAVYAGMSAHGKYVMINANAYKSGDATFNDATAVINWWNRCGPHCDSLCCEYWQQASGGAVILQPRTNGTAWYQHWDGWQRLPGVARGLGCDFAGLHYNPATDTGKMHYLKGSFLLEWNGTDGSVIMYKDRVTTVDSYNIAWTRYIGTPTGAKVGVGVGYMRHFTGGVVCVNPDPNASQAFSLGGTYLDDAGASHSSLTLGPGTANVLHT